MDYWCRILQLFFVHSFCMESHFIFQIIVQNPINEIESLFYFWYLVPVRHPVLWKKKLRINLTGLHNVPAGISILKSVFEKLAKRSWQQDVCMREVREYSL